MAYPPGRSPSLDVLRSLLLHPSVRFDARDAALTWGWCSAQALARLREAASRYERPAELGTLEVSIAPQSRRAWRRLAAMPSWACTGWWCGRRPWRARPWSS